MNQQKSTEFEHALTDECQSFRKKNKIPEWPISFIKVLHLKQYSNKSKQLAIKS